MREISMRYTGQRRSGGSVHYLLGNGYRGFNPVLKRFVSLDSMSPFGVGGEHGFIYCSNDPANQIDPSGHTPVSWLLFDIFSELIEGLVEDSIKESAELATTTKKTSSIFAIDKIDGSLRCNDQKYIELGYLKKISDSDDSLLKIHGGKDKNGEFLGVSLLNTNDMKDATYDYIIRTAEKLVDVLREKNIDLRGPEGSRLHFVSCHSGASAFATDLARIIGRPVVTYGGSENKLASGFSILREARLMQNGLLPVTSGTGLNKRSIVKMIFTNNLNIHIRKRERSFTHYPSL